MADSKLFGKKRVPTVGLSTTKSHGPRSARMELTFFIPEAALKKTIDDESEEEWAAEQAASFTERIAEDLLVIIEQYIKDDSKLEWTVFED